MGKVGNRTEVEAQSGLRDGRSLSVDVLGGRSEVPLVSPSGPPPGPSRRSASRPTRG